MHLLNAKKLLLLLYQGRLLNILYQLLLLLCQFAYCSLYGLKPLVRALGLLTGLDVIDDHMPVDADQAAEAEQEDVPECGEEHHGAESLLCLLLPLGPLAVARALDSLHSHFLAAVGV